MEKQRAQGRATGKAPARRRPASYGALLHKELGDTRFTGYDAIAAARGRDSRADPATARSEARPAVGGRPRELVVDETPFYAESGGQVGDTGSVGPFKVTDTLKASAPVPA